MDTNHDLPQALNYWRHHSDLTHLMPQRNFYKYHHMRQNTPPLSLPLKNDILTQTKKEEQETYHIKVNVTKMLRK